MIPARPVCGLLLLELVGLRVVVHTLHASCAAGLPFEHGLVCPFLPVLLAPEEGGRAAVLAKDSDPCQSDSPDGRSMEGGLPRSPCRGRRTDECNTPERPVGSATAARRPGRTERGRNTPFYRLRRSVAVGAALRPDRPRARSARARAILSAIGISSCGAASE